MCPLKKISPPTSVTLHLTEACNLRCKMCYFWGESGAYTKIKSKPNVLDFGILKGLVEELTNTESKPFYSLFGGEPLTYPHLEELVLAIKDTKSFIDTPTNGILLAEYAKFFVRSGFDQVRVSLDGTQEINDFQRGKGCYEKALNGINELHYEKQRAGFTKPRVGLLFTITKNNFQSIEDFFLNNPDLDLDTLYSVTFQMQNFITKEMGKQFENFLNTEFGISSEKKWNGLVRNTEEFNKIDVSAIFSQVNQVCKILSKRNINTLLLPPTFSPENLSTYLKADWKNMVDLYESCPVPWVGCEITASGEVAPCHVFHDFTLGNLEENSFLEVWYGEKYSKYRRYMEKNKFMPLCNIGCCILYIAGKRIDNKVLKK